MFESLKGVNEKSYTAEQSVLRWHQRRPLLRHFDIELTERCNNNCIHCCINLPERDRATQARELSTTAIKDLLMQGEDLGALTVRFTGGEPLLRPDFVELYLFARRLGLRIMLFTNARLITPELADLFSRIPPRETIEVTTYGMKADSYETVSRKHGSFAEFQRGIHLLIQYGIPFYIKGTMLPRTKSEYDDLIRWTDSLPGMKDLPSLVLFLELRHRRDSAVKNQRIEKLRLTPVEGLAVLAKDPVSYKQDLLRLCRYVAGRPTDKIFTCNEGNQLCIDSYGQIQHCLALRHPDTVVDSKKQTMRYALTEFFPKLREMRSHNPEYLNRCGKCVLRGLCEQCPAKSWIEHGVLDQPVEYCCEIAHAQARYIEILEGKEYGWEITDWEKRLLSLDELLSTKRNE